AADEEIRQLLEPGDPRRLRIEQRAATTIEQLERIVAHYADAEGIDAMDHYHALFALSMKHRFGPTPERQVDLNRRLHEIAVGLYGPDSNAAIDALGLYGEALGTYQPSEQALAVLHEALTKASALLGADHFTTEGVRRALARTYRSLNRPAEALIHA
ncbi:MAG: hypothetical protein WD114_02280, partial [Phycisphaerales bacterium]